MSLAELCEGCPDEILQFITYCRDLAYNAKPDYSYLRRLCRDLFFKKGYECDFTYDWMLKRKGPDDANRDSSKKPSKDFIPPVWQSP